MKKQPITMMSQEEQEARESLPDGYVFLGKGHEDCGMREFIVPKQGHFDGILFRIDSTIQKWGCNGEGWSGTDRSSLYAAPVGSEIAALNGYTSTEEDIEKPDTKPTNPKDALGVKKVPLSGMPITVLLECGLVKLHGDMKYGAYNWRDAGVRGSVYYDACIRHLAAWWEGEDLDPDSTVHHIAHAITGLCVLRDSMIQGNWTDDRPKSTKKGWINELNIKAEEIIEGSFKPHQH